jgi:hypothetical protein
VIDRHLRRWRVAIAALAVLTFAAVACTGDGIRIQIDTSPAPSTSDATPSPSVAAGGSQGLQVEPLHTGAARSAAAMRELCVAPTPVSTGGGSSGPVPPSIQEVEREVETVRGLRYLHPVKARAVTQEQIARELIAAFDDTYPAGFYDRRTVAWQTIGVIPTNVTIRDALLAFQTGQVVGFYNPVDGELVFIGDDDQLDMTEHFVLAHELTHAIDDQHFDLSRLDRLANTCRDESFEAAIGAVEGNAQYFATQVLTRFPDLGAGIGDAGGAGIPEGVPPFITALQLWPYDAGQSFITSLESRGGLSQVDDAIRDLPSTTEQVMHPERFPEPAPPTPNVADLSEQLGQGWGDLDVMQVGEEWLRAMLDLRLDSGIAADAAAGWNGGVYRSWTDGRDSAVLFRTAWDSPADAQEFADAVGQWIDAGSVSGFVAEPQGSTVAFGFATIDAARDVLSSAA